MSKYSLKDQYKNLLKEENELENAISFEDIIIDLKDKLIRKFYSSETYLSIQSSGEFFKGITRKISFNNLLMLLYVGKKEGLEITSILRNIDESYKTRVALAANKFIKGKVLSENTYQEPSALDKNQLQNIEKKVIDSRNFQDFHHNFCIYMIASCKLHKPHHISLSYTKDPVSANKRNMFIDDFINEFEVNIDAIVDDSSFNVFFTEQGTAIGCLFEDIFSKCYNNSQKLETKINIKKRLALIFCQILLDEFYNTTFNESLLDPDSLYQYESDFQDFYNDNIKNLNKITNFKRNIEKINGFENNSTKIFDIDNILNISNASFDFIISDKNYEKSTNVAVFDLKSSHIKSSGGGSSNIPTGSNLKNVATNELITISNISEDDVLDLDNVPSSFNKIKKSRYKSSKKQFKIIKSVSLVKAVWKIDQSGFIIVDLKATISSLNESTKENAKNEADQFKIPKKFSNIKISNMMPDEDIIDIKSFLDSSENKIIKGEKVQIGGIQFLESNLLENIDFNNESPVLKTNLKWETFKKAFLYYFRTSQKDFENYSNTLLDIDFFKDSIKIKLAIKFLEIFLSRDNAKKAKIYFPEFVNSMSTPSNAVRSIRGIIAYAIRDIELNNNNSIIDNLINIIQEKLNNSKNHYNGKANRRDDWLPMLSLLKQSLELAKQNESYGSGLDENYSIDNSLLKEVYSHLFKKKIVKEGGLGGHMRHPYENLDITPREMMDRIESYGIPQTVIDKVDGQNLFFTVERDGTLLFARNKQDMTHQDLVDKFTGHGAEAAFLEGGEAIKRGVEQWLNSAGNFAEQEILDIFHPTEDIRSFINFEIMHPKKSNQIQYDRKYIVFHSIVDFGEGRSQIFSSNQDERLKKLIKLMNPGVASAGFELASNREIDLNSLSNVQIMVYKDRIRDLIYELEMDEDEFLADGILRIIDKELEQEGISLEENTLKIMRDFVLYGEDSAGDAITSRDFTKHISKEDAKKLRELGLTNATKAKAKVANILSPFKEIFVDLGIDLLKGVKSAYLSPEKSDENIETLRDKLRIAIEDYDQYMLSTPEIELSKVALRLKPHVDKIKQVGIDKAVSTSVEGGVYTHDLDLEKITGGFAPLNQIIGAAYRDKEGIFPNFQNKFLKESKKYSLKNVFSLND